MSDELMAYLENKQEQIFRGKTDKFGGFKRLQDEAFWEGYVECQKDVWDFLEDKERNNQNDRN